MTRARILTLLRARVIWILLTAYVLGFFISKASGLKPETSLYILPVATAGLVCALFSGNRLLLFLLIGCALVLGFARQESSQAAYERGRKLLPYTGDGRVRLVLEVDRMPDVRTRYTVLYGTVKRIRNKGRWLAFNSSLRLSVAGSISGAYRGDRFLALASLDMPRTYDNPGGFDYEAWLARRGVAVTGWVDSPGLLHKIDRPNRHPLGLVDSARSRYLTYLHKIEGKGGALLAALLAGDRSSLPPEVKSVFEENGLSHLLAISGLHLGLLAATFYFLFHRLFKRLTFITRRLPAPRAAAFLTAPPVIAYALLTGMRLPTQRALVMVLVLMFALATEREKDTWNSLALAALAVLFIWPEALYEVSFQLSFTCLFGILYAMPRFEALYKGRSTPQEDMLVRLEKEGGKRWLPLRKAGGYLLGLFGVSVVALWSIFPLQAYLFHHANFLSPFYNLLAVPVCGLVVIPFGLLFSLVGLVFPEGGEVLLQLPAASGTVLVDILEYLSQAASTSLILPSLSPAGVVCWYLGGIILLEGMVALRCGSWSWRYYSPERIRHRRLGTWPAPVLDARWRRAWSAVLAGLVLFALSVYDLNRTRDPFAGRGAMVSAIEVGQGQALLVRTASGRYLLVDGGGFFFSDWDVGKNVVAPCLLFLGLKRIDAVVLSHPHPDHGRGLAYILRNFQVSEFWLGPPSSELSRTLVNIAASRDIRIRRLTESSRRFEFGSAGIEVLHPPPQADYAPENLNNSSLVLRVELGKFALLLTGDIEKEVEKLLVEKYGPEGSVKAGMLASEVMSIPHHGSKTSSQEIFIDAVSPAYALVSAAGPSRTGLPSPEVLERFHERGTEVLRTDVHGFSGVFEKGGPFEEPD
ncbi:MAG: DNA internalization-related competence protein ComEC/Rec2 [bacterium]